MNKTPTFNDFWRAYPLHVSKKRAESAWNRLTARDKRLAIAAIPSYVAYIQTMPTPSYRNPQGWLNDRRWEDELAATTPPQPLPSEGRGADAATKKEQSRFHVSMLGQMNVRGKADGLNVPAIIIPEPTMQDEGEPETDSLPDGMDKW